MINTKSLSRALLVAALSAAADAFSAPTASTTTSVNPMFEKLKNGGQTPNFDVLQKTIEYTGYYKKNGEAPGPEWYDDDYVLRGPVIGPTNRKDLQEAQSGFDLKTAYPDLTISTFGHTVDPENPFRCFYFERWRGTHMGTLMAGDQAYEATGNFCETPVSVFCATWTPEGKIIYEQVGAPVDRFEGNTKGKAAVFGLLHAAGLKLPAAPGNLVMRILQRVGHLLKNGGRSWSKEEDIPEWWTSKSRGADPTDT